MTIASEAGHPKAQAIMTGSYSQSGRRGKNDETNGTALGAGRGSVLNLELTSKFRLPIILAMNWASSCGPNFKVSASGRACSHRVNAKR